MCYIGVSYDPKYRFMQHYSTKRETRSIIANAIKKYGKEKFKLEVLLLGTREYCYFMEKKYIEFLNCRSPYGYNICAGGIGSAGLCGELNGAYGRCGPLNPQYGKVGKDAAFYGRKHTPETKAKMSASRTGLKRTPEAINNDKKAAFKRWQNPDYRKKVLMAKGYWNPEKEEIA